MFKQTLLSASIVAVAVAGPVPHVRRSSSVQVINGGGIGGLSGSSLIGGEPTLVWPMNNRVFDSSSIAISGFNQGQSFDHWGGISSLVGFDSFHGSDNFCGLNNQQTFTSTVQCQQLPVHIIQQQLAIIAEHAKRVLLSHTCEVETQTVVWNQWFGHLQGFGDEIRHANNNGRSCSFDSSIASHISEVCNHDGSINTNGWNFGGSIIGSQSVTIQGGNWNPQTSPQSCEKAFSQCQQAAGVPIAPPTSSSVSQLCGSSCGLSIPGGSSVVSGGSTVISGSSGCGQADCGLSSGGSVISGGSSVISGGSVVSGSSGCGQADCGLSSGGSVISGGSVVSGGDSGLSTLSDGSVQLPTSGLSTLSDGSIPQPTDISGSLGQEIPSPTGGASPSEVTPGSVVEVGAVGAPVSQDAPAPSEAAGVVDVGSV